MLSMLRNGANTRAHASSDTVLPTPRVDRSPVDQRDYDDRHEIRATTDDDTLRRYIRLRWHLVLQSLVSVVGVAVVAVVGYVLCRQTGLAAAQAAIFIVGVLSLAVAGAKRVRRRPPAN